MFDYKNRDVSLLILNQVFNFFLKILFPFQVNAYHARQILGGKISIDKMNNIRMFSCSFDTCMMELDETAEYRNYVIMK